MANRRTEYDPAVQQLADEINETWNKVRATLLGLSNYKAKPHHRKSWVKAALLIIDRDIDVERFVRAQLRTQADASRCHPNWLGTEKALDRYDAYDEKVSGVDKNFYVGQVSLAANLHEQGYSWEEIVTGPFRMSPLTCWVLSSLNSLDADRYRNEAIVEYRKCPDAQQVFEDALEGLL